MHSRLHDCGGWLGRRISEQPQPPCSTHFLSLSSFPEQGGGYSVTPSSGNGTLQRKENLTKERQSLALHANRGAHVIPVD